MKTVRHVIQPYLTMEMDPMTERRELIFSDSKSNKFWNIELNGSDYTVNYGRVGTKGQTNTKSFDSADDAKADYDKIVAAKLKKGYADTASEPTMSSATPLDFSTFARAGSQWSHVDSLAGAPVTGISNDEAPVTIEANIAYRLAASYEETWDPAWEKFFSKPQPATHLVIGAWAGEELYDTEAPVEELCAEASKLPDLRALFLGDIIAEENEISWIQQADVSPLLAAFPKLELLRVRGGSGLAFTENRHANLRGLAFETGGMDASVVQSVANADLPNLEYLELWLGSEHYGATGTVEDLQPLLNGEQFPKLRYLGLRNCHFVDDIANVIANSPLVDRIKTLDLSMGTLSDAGGTALLKLPTDGALKTLNLNHNYLTHEVATQLEALPFEVDTSERETPHDYDGKEYRYVSVGE